ncbi:hypothetical protein [Streptomyces bambusae]|uniref:Uncharacterized protein n=1 Tax=Streptomyces bambusae TaxID=1550616 RepID=A0ABS6ZAN9_9ACTN|nr:hypothetical protein [Streptomyces bambusae]MBW5484651.1 hypothetical protein [Streptomyces bambusae]
MTQSGQGGDQSRPAERPAYEGAPPAGDPWGAPAPHPGPAQPGHVQPGHVLGPGYEGPGAPHGYGYPPLPDAATQYIPPVPGGPAAEAPYPAPVPGGHAADAATQYMAPVPGGHAADAATQYIPPVPAGGGDDAATQYIPPVPADPAAEAATQYIPPVPADPAADYEGLFRDSGPAQGQTQVLPPVPAGPVSPHAGARPYNGRRPGAPQPPQQPQHYAPYDEEPARRISPAVIAAGVFALLVIGLGVGSLLGDDAKPSNDDPAAIASTPAPAASASASTAADAPVDPARPQAVQLDKLLADSNDGRASVVKAVDDIKSCKNLDSAAKDLREAARQREGLVTRLQELKIDKLPDNAQLSAALTKAWRASATADNHYAAWADELDDRKKDCKDDRARPTAHTVDATKASAEATKAKETAATLWNRIATQYGLTKRDKSQL